MSNTTIFERIAHILEQRKGASPDESYVAALCHEGDEAIFGKIIEEARELVEAGRGGDPGRMVHETADLWFHCQVLLAHRNVALGDVCAELERRFGTSGHEEKRRRSGD